MLKHSLHHLNYKGEINMRKYILGIIGFIVWLFLLITFIMADITHGNNTHQLMLIITGICLALYIWKSKSSEKQMLEKENQELKEEIKALKKKLEEVEK